MIPAHKRNFLHSSFVQPALFRLLNLKIRPLLTLYSDLEREAPDVVREYQLQKLKKLLKASYLGSPFYKARLDSAGLKPNSINSLKSISVLPPLEKGDIKSNRDSMLIGAGKQRTFRRKSAGTTGQPLEILVSAEALSAQLAARFRCQSWFGHKIGDREARFWGRQSNGFKQKISSFLLNRKIFQLAGKGRSDVENEIKALVHFCPEYFYGYSSLIFKASQSLPSWYSDSLALKFITCTAEDLPTFQKNEISKKFNCPVVREYGCSEVDIIAFECEYGNYHLQSENLLVEIDSDSGGEGEILVTDLNNSVMPLIRYRVGDIGQINLDSCSCGRTLPILENLKGRSIKRLVKLPDGREKHASLFAYFFEEISQKETPILQFKITQKTIDSFLVQIHLAISEDSQRVENLFRDKMHKNLGHGVNFDFEFGEIIRSGNQKWSYFQPLE